VITQYNGLTCDRVAHNVTNLAQPYLNDLGNDCVTLTGHESPLNWSAKGKKGAYAPTSRIAFIVP